MDGGHCQRQRAEEQTPDDTPSRYRFHLRCFIRPHLPSSRLSHPCASAFDYCSSAGMEVFPCSFCPRPPSRATACRTLHLQGRRMEGCSRLDAEAETAERMRALSTECIPCPPSEQLQQWEDAPAMRCVLPRRTLLIRECSCSIATIQPRAAPPPLHCLCPSRLTRPLG